MLGLPLNRRVLRADDPVAGRGSALACLERGGCSILACNDTEKVPATSPLDKLRPRSDHTLHALDVPHVEDAPDNLHRRSHPAARRSPLRSTARPPKWPCSTHAAMRRNPFVRRKLLCFRNGAPNRILGKASVPRTGSSPKTSARPPPLCGGRGGCSFQLLRVKQKPIWQNWLAGLNGKTFSPLTSTKPPGAFPAAGSCDSGGVDPGATLLVERRIPETDKAVKNHPRRNFHPSAAAPESKACHGSHACYPFGAGFPPPTLTG